MIMNNIRASYRLSHFLVFWCLLACLLYVCVVCQCLVSVLCAYVPLGLASCPHCLRVMTRINLSRHIRVQHSATMQPAECVFCGKIFKCSYNMKEHQRTAHGIFQKML